MHLEGNYMPADYPPFNFLADDDPESGGNNDVLAVAKTLGKIPKIIVTNNAAEYWDRSASLIHTNLDGSKDASIHENVRIFLTNGAPHGPARSRHVDVAEHSVSTIDADFVVRSTLIMLDEWASKDIKPADSRYPRLDRDELITAVEHKQQMPLIPGMRHPGTNLHPPLCEYGTDFWSKGIMTNIPPIITGHYPTFVPAIDTDGNGLGGIRLPDITVPLGTYQGFNPRKQHANAPDYLVGHVGSFWPFATTKKERIKNGDPRPSLEERYGGKKENYIEQVIMEVNKLLTDRLLTREDADKIIAEAKVRSWPPLMLETNPFWEQQNKKKD